MIGTTALVVLVFAAYRITRLITTDSITDGFRDRLYGWAWDDDNPVECPCDDGTSAICLCPTPRAPWRTWVHTLFTCGWCLGVWVSAGVYSAWRWWDTPAVRAVIVVAAIAGGQGLLASRRDA